MWEFFSILVPDAMNESVMEAPSSTITSLPIIDPYTFAPALIIEPVPMALAPEIVALVSICAPCITTDSGEWLITFALRSAGASASPLTRSREPFMSAFGVPISNQ